MLEQEQVPSHSCLLLADRDEARNFPSGAVRLVCCRACGFIANQAFDQSLSAYSSSYEETQGFSARFRQFAHDLAACWIDRYNIHEKTILEIGCGKGEFLALMCELGDNRGIGIDPSYVPERLESSAVDRMQFIRELYTERHLGPSADVVVCRHTLEHIAPVADFMRLVRRGIGERTDVTVLFELPDVLRVLREFAFWDIYYEHCSYFSLGSLARLFAATGFDVLDLSLGFEGQYLLVEARPASVCPAPMTSKAGADDLDEVLAAVRDFREGYAKKLQEWRSELLRMTASGRRAVIWGAGSKGVAYLSTLGLEGAVEYAVDINPYKQGMYLAGSGLPVVGPEFLREQQPDSVIAMNPVYLDEIQAELDRLGVDACLSSV